MNILFTRFPLESAHGGAEVQTLALMSELKKRGHKVAFLGSCPTLTVLCKQNNIPFLDLKVGPPPVSLFTLLRFFVMRRHMRKSLCNVFREFAERKLDAVCMLSLTEKLLLTPLALDYGLKILWIEHDSIGRWLTWNPFLGKLRKLSKHVLTVGVSQMSAEAYGHLGWDPETVVAIPNGVDAERFAISQLEESKSETPQFGREHLLHVGCVARLHREKGIDVLLKSIVELPQLCLTVVGVGDQKSVLEDLTRKLRLADRVQILDRVGKLANFYDSLDIFVLPSRTHDPFGLVAAEAMCNGIPTIVTAVCGIAREITDGKDGIVVQEDSVEALREALSFLVADPVRRKGLGQAGRKKALADFTIEGMVDAYERCLQS